MHDPGTTFRSKLARCSRDEGGAGAGPIVANPAPLLLPTAAMPCKK